MERIFRVFISSVGSLLEEERKIAIDSVLKSNNLPISMERFVGPNNLSSIDIIIKYLNMSDVVFILIGHLYGNIVKDLKFDDCPLKEKCKWCTEKKSFNCVISYTHFEYLFAKYNNKVYYCFKLNGFNDDSVFEKSLATKANENKKDDFRKYYRKGKKSNKQFIDEIGSKFYINFNDQNEFSGVIKDSLDEIKTLEALRDAGLIEANRKGIVDALTVKTQDPARDAHFATFNQNIAHSLDVYGMGITKLSEKNIWIKTLINEGKEINLCMINPQILNENTCAQCEVGSIGFLGICDLLGKYNFQVAKTHFDKYSAKTKYYDKIANSFNNLKNIISEIKANGSFKGKITLRIINSFLPMSINIKDKGTKQAKILVEFGLPFTDNKTMMEITNNSKTIELFNNLLLFYDEIIKNSTEVDLYDGGKK